MDAVAIGESEPGYSVLMDIAKELICKDNESHLIAKSSLLQ